MSFLIPININEWIKKNLPTLRPPVGNKVLYSDKDFIVMMMGGPNLRTDFHINQTEEFFYQIKGNITITIMQDCVMKDIHVKEGEMFLLPRRIPHSPQRPSNTVGLLIESVRKPGQLDGFRWYCNSCKSPLYEEFFQLTNIETQIPPIFERFYSNKIAHICKNCGENYNV